jgi:stage II sporulation protein D
MRRIVLLSMILLLAALLVPILFVGQAALTSEEGELPPEESDSLDAADSWDHELQFNVLTGGEVQTVTMDEYLPGVLAGEMPATFELEALKAQAVAARTYILYKMQRESTAHPEADVCDDPACCKAYVTQEKLQENWGDNYEANFAKIQEAVQSTDGLYLTYEGEPIQAVFHSSSSGKTEDSGSIWSAVPYLVSVDSPETEQSVPNYVSTVEMSPEEFRQAVGEEAGLGEDPGTWITDVRYNNSGRVDTITVGNCTWTGNEARQKFDLRSTAFTVKYTGESFQFTVTGYGHGVGMSQYGANTMALEGSNYEEILTHYYVGAELTDGGKTLTA